MRWFMNQACICRIVSLPCVSAQYLPFGSHFDLRCSGRHIKPELSVPSVVICIERGTENTNPYKLTWNGTSFGFLVTDKGGKCFMRHQNSIFTSAFTFLSTFG